MFKKIACVALAVMVVLVSLVLAGGHHDDHHGISLPAIPLPTLHLDTSGLFALLKRPPIPIVHLPSLHLGGHGLHLPLPSPIPVLSFPHSDHHGHHGHHDEHHGEHGFEIIGNLLNTIIGGHDDHWAK